MTNALTKTGDVQGKALVGREGAKLGTVREMFVDLTSGRTEFIIAEGASLLGGSGKYYPVPWNVVRYDAVATSFQIEISKDEFKAAPSYDRDQLANAGYGWEEQATRYFSTSPPTIAV